MQSSLRNCANSCAAISRSRAPRSSAAITARFTTIDRNVAALNVWPDADRARGDGTEIFEVEEPFPNGDVEDLSFPSGDKPDEFLSIELRRSFVFSVHPGLPSSSFKLSTTSCTTPCVKYSRTKPSHSRLKSTSVV